jgi:uncharacterized RDD family membrane protein YckC
MATAVAQVLAGRLSSRLWLYVIAVLCAGAAWVVGVLSAVQVLVSGPVPSPGLVLTLGAMVSRHWPFTRERA